MLLPFTGARFPIPNYRQMGYLYVFNSMSFLTTMIRDIISQSTEDMQRADGMQGHAPVAILSNEVFSDNYEMDQVNVSHGALSAFVSADIPLRINLRTAV